MESPASAKRGGAAARMRARDRLHAVVAGMVGDRDRSESPQRGSARHRAARNSSVRGRGRRGAALASVALILPIQAEKISASCDLVHCSRIDFGFRMTMFPGNGTTHARSTVGLRATLVVVPSSGAARLRTVW